MKTVKTFCRIMPIAIKATPLLFVFIFIVGSLPPLFGAASVAATQVLFDTVIDVAAGSAEAAYALIPLLVLSSFVLGQNISLYVYSFMATYAHPKSVGRIKRRLVEKIGRIDPAYFEDTDFLDNVNKAHQATDSVNDFANMVVIIVTAFGVYFLAIGAYLFSVHPILLVSLLLAFVPALFELIVRMKIFTKLEDESAPLRRQYGYFQQTICAREYLKETRILGAFNYFYQRFTQTMHLFTQKHWQAERKTNLLRLVLNISTFAGMAVAAIILFNATMDGRITMGAFAAVFGTLSMLFGIMQRLVNVMLGSLYQDMGKIANFIRLLDWEERPPAKNTPNFAHGIVADGVSFTYHGRDVPAVQDISLKINPGETIAIVGENGAGKSTLVRLLTGIFQPTQGSVLIGGVQNPTFEGISAVFQQYVRYKMTLAENVGISDVYSTEAPTLSLYEAGVDHASIGADTMLSPEFDGIDLSGGQWQRVAIARGLYRTSQFIVLDEPTAAIDPLEETRIFEQFQALTHEKCAIIVTHRLGSAKLAHRIIVMEEGRITDSGTHDELLARPGKYAAMWAAQAQWYAP